MGEKRTISDNDWHLQAGNGRGWSEFYDHDEVSDEDYEITLTVKKMWKQFHDDCVYNNVSDNVQSVQKKLESLEKKMKGLDKLESLEKKIKGLERLESLEKSVKSLLDKRVVAHNQTPQIPYPECPICLENMTQGTRIMQCSAGHLICGGCYDKLNPKLCPSCKNGIIGRCHGMESYLRTLFATN